MNQQSAILPTTTEPRSTTWPTLTPATSTQPQQPPPSNKSSKPDDGTTWWCRILARGVGCVSGIVAIITGIIACIDIIHPLCIVAGVWQMLAGVLVIAFEAPCCCALFEFINKIGSFAERRPHWQKAGIYGGIAILPIAMCFGVTTIFGSGLIFATGTIYGLMALGKKADRDEMMTRVRNPDDTELNSSLIKNEVKQ